MRATKQFFLTLFVVALTASAQAWDYEGHRMVAAVAVASLPEDFPEFARSNAVSQEVQFDAGLPDRWRNLQEPALQHINEPDHYLDMEEMKHYGLTPETMPEFRNELIGLIYAERKLHPDQFTPPNPTQDLAKVHVLFGLLPYAINENFLKLESEFVTLRKMEIRNASPSDFEWARRDAIHTMGVLSHFVGDGAQPLHLTKHHHGWVGRNRHGYTREHSIHGLIDGGVIAAAGITYDTLSSRVEPAHLIWPGDYVPEKADAFPEIMNYLGESHALVEPLYRMEKNGDFNVDHPSPAGRALIETQLLRGGQFLGDIFYSAYRAAQAVPLDTYK